MIRSPGLEVKSVVAILTKYLHFLKVPWASFDPVIASVAACAREAGYGDLPFITRLCRAPPEHSLSPLASIIIWRPDGQIPCSVGRPARSKSVTSCPKGIANLFCEAI